MKHDVLSDTWVATDALGRKLPGWEECGSPRSGKFVGIFYFICNVYDGSEFPQDVTKTIAANPANPGFKPNIPYYWGEPELGYYRSTDRWVIRKHAYQLADAGVDTLIFDVTNDLTFTESYTAICEVFRQIRAEGEKTPDVCFLGSDKSIYRLWEDFYSKGLFSDLWFRWKGKPLLLFGHHSEIHGDMNKVVFPPHIQNFLTSVRAGHGIRSHGMEKEDTTVGPGWRITHNALGGTCLGCRNRYRWRLGSILSLALGAASIMAASLK